MCPKHAGRAYRAIGIKPHPCPRGRFSANNRPPTRAVWASVFLIPIATQTIAGAGFSLGVSAGDVTPTGAILWTRADDAIGVVAEVATDADFSAVIFRADAEATPDNDQTIRVTADGLPPDTTLYYRFSAKDQPDCVSRVGQFRTAPLDGDNRAVRFAYSGDSDFRYAPFGILGHAAREDLDFFIWFGDTIYGDVPAGGLGRATTLADYRAKYRQMRSDPYLQELAASTAFYVGWDDHEIYNDYAGMDPDLSAEQREAAYQAFFEYMPIRANPAEEWRTYRQFRYGSMLELFLLDDRQYRDQSVEDLCNALDPYGVLLGPFGKDNDCIDLLDSPRSMLGDAQFDWLVDGLRASETRYRFVVESITMSFVGLLPYDHWDGYEAERRRLLEAIDQSRIENVIVLATDIHASAYNPDLTVPFRFPRGNYDLPNGIRVQELVAGPIGTTSFKEAIVGVGAEFLGAPRAGFEALFDALEPLLLTRLRQISNYRHFEPNRFSYVRIDIGEDGRAKATSFGLPPSRSDVDTGELERVFEADLSEPAAGLPCGLPIGVLMAGLGLAASRTAPGRSSAAASGTRASASAGASARRGRRGRVWAHR
ncbi:MAG: alkaline phosphatase D family protein [Phycisphaerales bacterium]|nr:alkaline phosphatase D family protein [Phycisphaerales bacterium]